MDDFSPGKGIKFHPAIPADKDGADNHGGIILAYNQLGRNV
jgi:hypothetical protein